MILGMNNSNIDALPAYLPKDILTLCTLGRHGVGFMRMATTTLYLSARAYDRMLKVSRSVADIALSRIRHKKNTEAQPSEGRDAILKSG